MFCILASEELWLKIAPLLFLQNLDKFGLKLYAVYKSNVYPDKRNQELTYTSIRPNYGKRTSRACVRNICHFLSYHNKTSNFLKQQDNKNSHVPLALNMHLYKARFYF